MEKKDMNPYRGLSLLEVEHAEANHYYLQVGHEVAVHDGFHTFSKKKAEYLFWQLFDSLEHMRENGNTLEKDDALHCLLNFKLHKLRIH